MIKAFVGCCFQRTTNSNTHSQQGRWEQGQSPVGGDCYHTIINLIFKMKSWLFFMPNIGAMAYPKGISVGHRPHGFLDIKTLSARFYCMPILLNGALENSTLRDFKC